MCYDTRFERFYIPMYARNDKLLIKIKIIKPDFLILRSLAREIPALRSNSARLTLSELNFSPNGKIKVNSDIICDKAHFKFIRA